MGRQIDSIINSESGECWQETRRVRKYNLPQIVADLLTRYTQENPTDTIREISIEIKEVNIDGRYGND